MAVALGGGRSSSWKTGPGFPETFPGLVHTCLHTGMCTHMYTQMNMHTHTHMRTYAHVHIHTYAHVPTCAHLHIPLSQLELDKPQAAQVTEKTVDMSSGETVPGPPPSDPQLSWF